MNFKIMLNIPSRFNVENSRILAHLTTRAVFGNNKLFHLEMGCQPSFNNEHRENLQIYEIHQHAKGV